MGTRDDMWKAKIALKKREKNKSKKKLKKIENYSAWRSKQNRMKSQGMRTKCILHICLLLLLNCSHYQVFLLHWHIWRILIKITAWIWNLLSDEIFNIWLNIVQLHKYKIFNYRIANFINFDLDIKEIFLQ